ncbi:shikimate kinase [Listeria aquatica]|uniref:Shikimate kinase n=1 Tax=Listeria aquatica TaxID=1494960 RepID=A0A841ZT89_9LIST|nr:shikimate kinase [Listeria aquatica]
MKSIILIGFMASGKTTVGELLAKKTGLPFVDIDRAIENEQQKSISAIFSESGEAYFRELEQKKLSEFKTNAAVISTGGGIITTEATRTFLQQHPATIIYLKTSPMIFLARLKGDETRPLAKNQTPEEIEKLFQSREAHYEAIASFSIETDSLSPLEIVSEIQTQLS